jgi:hypothetical protein
MVVHGGSISPPPKITGHDDMSLSNVSLMFFLDVLFSLYYVPWIIYYVPWFLCPVYDGSLTDVSPSDSAVREENEGTRKPRELQKTNEMRVCA